MQSAPYRQAIIDYITVQAQPVDKFSHQPRLYSLVTRIAVAEGKPYDDEVVFAAVWMHDLGVFVGHRPEDPKALAAWDHVAYAFRVVPDVLKQSGFPASKVPAVLEVIRTHLPHTEPTCYEGVLVRDADLLEQLGAVAVMRTVCKIGRDTRFSRFSDALRVLKRNVEEIPARLKLDASRRLAEPRIRLLREFLTAAEAEADGQPL